jgi:hypothetical protein
VGDLPGKTKVHKAEQCGVEISTLDMLEQLLQGALTFQEFIDTPAAVIGNYSEGFQGQHQERQANTAVVVATAGQAEVEAENSSVELPDHQRSRGRAPN